jgi:thymidylate kinase
MLIIFEGLDKSGKSTLASAIHSMLPGSIMIKKQFEPALYPINYSKASVYDWQAMFDRIILANPDVTFIADRSFFTQTVYQLCLGHDSDAITDEQMHMFNAYCAVMQKIPHLVIYCKSSQYELDNLVTNLEIRSRLDAMYEKTMLGSSLNSLVINAEESSLASKIHTITDKIKEILCTQQDN